MYHPIIDKPTFIVAVVIILVSIAIAVSVVGLTAVNIIIYFVAVDSKQHCYVEVFAAYYHC